MILTKDMLTNTMKKGRLNAVALLNDFARMAKLPEAHFEYEARGSTKKRWHFYKARFRVPQALRNADKNKNLWEYTTRGGNVMVHGCGGATKKADAKSYAALEVVHRLEEALEVPRNGLTDLLNKMRQEMEEKQAAIEATPVTEEIPGVSWKNLPVDVQFPEPGDRKGRIIFTPNILDNPTALLGARVLTLSSRGGLPTVVHHSNHRDEMTLQNWANIRADGKIKGVAGPVTGKYGLSKLEAEEEALNFIGVSFRKVARSQSKLSNIAALLDNKPTSFGMAKLFVKLPKHRVKEIMELVEEIEENSEVSKRKASVNSRKRCSKKPIIHSKDNEAVLKARVATFRKHQTALALPVDQVEEHIPYDAAVTIVRGGTGSGKTTRYPLMLSIFSNHPTQTNIVVAQPRRLACQTAAQRVAFEQDVRIGEPDCPIGYSIRFESRPSNAQGRTVDFETPGVILRRATEDPLLSHASHLVIDEVHERNADMDMLLALAKQAQSRRMNHPSLKPLKIVLMSATLDTDEWETYFDNHKVALVDVPDARRFPIDIIHAGEKRFPHLKSSSKWLMKGRKNLIDDLDEKLCQAVAELAVLLLQRNDIGEGSILCFLPGMEEIQAVSRLISQHKAKAKICFLHSSLSSKEQAKVFIPGQKIILSTNIAETSLTIPDVKIVIDSGRERQHSLMESASESRTTSVVGSQLATVDISQASAKQRAGRAGRVSAGTCYRLYTREDIDSSFTPFTPPEMQRMELSQLVLHSLSLYHPSSGHPLHLLLGAPDPPSHIRLKQTLFTMSQQSLLTTRGSGSHVENMDVDLTPLGQAVSGIPASPRIARMLFMGLALRAIDPALTIAALLSVPKAFNSKTDYDEESGDDVICSDVVLRLADFENYLAGDAKMRMTRQEKFVFNQVLKVRRQLEKSMKDHLPKPLSWNIFNSNEHRVAAQAALICGATPHIAHLVAGKGVFATRDAIAARIHPSSVNFDHSRRSHWYLYHELRTTKAPYMHVTTAASPLELALFCDSSAGTVSDSEHTEDEEWGEKEEWVYIADQWVPVSVATFPQRNSFIKLRRVLNFDLLNHIASDPQAFVNEKRYEQLVLCIFSSMEQERIAL
eukprot:scaffold34595_cov160-Amphora_coffeaeformis.AAC.21